MSDIASEATHAANSGAPQVRRLKRFADGKTLA
jgi:hypothetical protein